MHEDIIKDVRVSDFSTDLQMMLEIVGLEKMTAIIVELNGMDFYISKTPLIEASKRYIIRNAKKRTTKQLAKDAETTEREVYKVIAEKKMDTVTRPLFEEYN